MKIFGICTGHKLIFKVIKGEWAGGICPMRGGNGCVPYTVQSCRLQGKTNEGTKLLWSSKRRWLDECRRALTRFLCPLIGDKWRIIFNAVIHTKREMAWSARLVSSPWGLCRKELAYFRACGLMASGFSWHRSGKDLDVSGENLQITVVTWIYDIITGTVMKCYKTPFSCLKCAWVREIIFPIIHNLNTRSRKCSAALAH